MPMLPSPPRSLWCKFFVPTPLVLTLGMLTCAPSLAEMTSDLPTQPLEAQTGLPFDGVPFYSVPRLIYTGTNRDDIHARSATYYFTLTFPASEGAALETLDLIQIEGIPITLVPDKTIAFLGTRSDRGGKCDLANPLRCDIPVRVQTLAQGEHRGENRSEQTGLRIQFEEPVSPNQTLTLAVRARSNPFQDGVYLYALVAYPQGNVKDGYRVGTGRLHFYENTPFRL